LIWFECLLWLIVCTNLQCTIQILKKSECPLTRLRYDIQNILLCKYFFAKLLIWRVITIGFKANIFFLKKMKKMSPLMSWQSASKLAKKCFMFSSLNSPLNSYLHLLRASPKFKSFNLLKADFKSKFNFPLKCVI